ncbi:hypothetical protein ACFL2H_07510 [Planctomycetota bacterium]
MFRCRLDNIALEKLHWELNQILDDVDDLLVIPLCASCAGKVPIHSSGDRSDWAETPRRFVLFESRIAAWWNARGDVFQQVLTNQQVTKRCRERCS